MRPSQLSALAAMADRFSHLPSLVGGSALLALLGVDLEPGDIDVVMATDSRDDLRRAAGQWWRGSRVDTSNPHWRSSWLADLEVDGEAVEVIGGLTAMVDGAEWKVPMRSGGAVEVAGRVVRLAAVGHWVVLYTLYRPSRVSELAPYLTDEEKQKTLMELPAGVGIEWP